LIFYFPPRKTLTKKLDMVRSISSTTLQKTKFLIDNDAGRTGSGRFPFFAFWKITSGRSRTGGTHMVTLGIGWLACYASKMQLQLFNSTKKTNFLTEDQAHTTGSWHFTFFVSWKNAFQ